MQAIANIKRQALLKKRENRGNRWADVRREKAEKRKQDREEELAYMKYQ